MKLSKFLANRIFRVGQYNHDCIRRLAPKVKNKKILELGSGNKNSSNPNEYSLVSFFDSSNDFTQSDIVKEYGHKVVDITKFKARKRYDVILCTNVLEHVYDFQKAIANIYSALKQGGILVLFVPAFYPLHDEPHDYWRFTEHSFRKLLKNFKSVTISRKGPKKYPLAYFVIASR